MIKFAKNPMMAFVVLLAVCLQIQVTLFASAHYMGLRVNLADVFLPVMIAAALVSLLLKKTKLPVWSVHGMWFWLAGLCAVMLVALINGYWTNGFISQWSFINKFLGFFVLCGYLFLGGWIVQNIKDPDKAISVFMRIFAGFFILTVLMSAVLGLLQGVVPFPFWLSDFAWDGFMANRNAFMFVAVFVMIYLMATRQDFSFTRSLWFHHLFWFLLPVFCLYNASRTGWICFAFIFAFYVYLNPWKNLKSKLVFLLLGICFASASFYIDSIPAIEKQRQFYRMMSLATVSKIGPDGTVYYEGDQQRLTAVEDGLELYTQSNFLLGSGLGSYKEFQIEKRGKHINLIDFTALWLLVETGALGLSVFAAFFVVCVHALYQSGLRGGNSVHRALFFFLIVAAIISTMHELMYTRFIWFMLGLTLVSFQVKRQP